MGEQPALFELDQLRFAQNLQVVRDGRLLDAEVRLDVTDADALVFPGQMVKDLEPHRVGKGLEQRRRMPDPGFIRKDAITGGAARLHSGRFLTIVDGFVYTSVVIILMNVNISCSSCGLLEG
jgi:hypothetical protein